MQASNGTNVSGWSYLSLFSSISTLLCCALPSLLVLIGLGATVASVLATVPWLITLSKDKDWVFGISGVLIFSNLIYVYRIAPRLKTPDASCKIQNAELCKTASRLSRVLLWFSAAIYAIGFFSAYVLGPILIWLDSR